MYPYNLHSQKAEEFINHEEILETLAYAEENKHNIPLIDSIIEKAKLRKGLSHRGNGASGLRYSRKKRRNLRVGKAD